MAISKGMAAMTVVHPVILSPVDRVSAISQWGPDIISRVPRYLVQLLGTHIFCAWKIFRANCNYLMVTLNIVRKFTMQSVYKHKLKTFSAEGNFLAAVPIVLIIFVAGTRHCHTYWCEVLCKG